MRKSSGVPVSFSRAVIAGAAGVRTGVADVIVIDSSAFSDELLPAPSLYKPAATTIEAVPLLPAVGVKVAV